MFVVGRKVNMLNKVEGGEKREELRGEAKDILRNISRRNGRKMPFLFLVTLTFVLTFKLVEARDQTRLADISGSRDISYTNKKSQTAPKTEPYAVHCVR